MIIIINHKQLKELKKIMSKFLDDFHALLNQVATGQPGDSTTKDAIEKLQTHLEQNDATDEEQSQAILELVKKLADSVPPGTTPPAPAAVAVISGMSPVTGSQNGGDTVSLSGSGFTGATGVMFGHVAGTDLVVNSDTSMTVVTPAQAPGTVDVTVVTPAGTSGTGAATSFVVA